MNNFHKTKITEYIKDVWGRIEWEGIMDYLVLTFMFGVVSTTLVIILLLTESYKEKLRSTIYEVYENGRYIKDVRECDFIITKDCVKVQQDWYGPQVTLKFKYKKGEKD